MEGIQVKINQSGFYYCCCLFSKSHIVHTQNTQSKMYSPNPWFSATGSIQHQISKAVGSADTDFSSVPWSSSPSGHPAVRFKTCPSSFSLPGSSEPRLRIYYSTALQPSTTNLCWGRIQNHEMNEMTGPVLLVGQSPFQVNCCLLRSSTLFLDAMIILGNYF